MDLFILALSLYMLIKRKIAWVLLGLLLLTTNYLNAGSNTSEFPIEHNVSDSGLVLYFALFAFLVFNNKGKVKSTTLGKFVLAFYLFLILSIIVDLTVNQIDFISIIKTSRHWIFLSSIWVFYYIPKTEVKKLIDYLLISTAIISGIILVDFFTDLQILENIESEKFINGNVLKRSAIPSTYVIFILLLILSGYFRFINKIKYGYLLLFSMALITSVIRSWVLATIVGIMLVYITKDNFNHKNILRGLLVVSLLIGVIFSVPAFKNRFVSGIDEIQSFNLKSEVKGNFSFRIVHIVERAKYVYHISQYSIFGVGNITEEDFPKIFKTGLRNESGRSTQLDTGDNAWSLLFVRLGFVGTLMYTMIYIKVIINTIRYQSRTPLAVTLIVYLLINFMFLSFASSSIAMGQFGLVPFILYSYTSNERKEE